MPTTVRDTSADNYSLPKFAFKLSGSHLNPLIACVGASGRQVEGLKGTQGAHVALQHAEAARKPAQMLNWGPCTVPTCGEQPVVLLGMASTLSARPDPLQAHAHLAKRPKTLEDAPDLKTF